MCRRDVGIHSQVFFVKLELTGALVENYVAAAGHAYLHLRWIDGAASAVPVGWIDRTTVVASRRWVNRNV